MDATLLALDGNTLNAIITLAREEVLPRHAPDYPTASELDTAHAAPKGEQHP